MGDVTANPVLAEVIRSGFVESRHRGTVVALAADGTFAFTAGIANAPIFPRSSNKPLQAAAMLRAGLPLDGELLVMVNGMGGTPLIELYVMYEEVARTIAARGGRIARNLVGNYITSLEMQGFSVTVCGLTDQLTRLWDAPVDTAALRWGR